MLITATWETAGGQACAVQAAPKSETEAAKLAAYLWRAHEVLTDEALAAHESP